jgi:hypothetical protein
VAKVKAISSTPNKPEEKKQLKMSIRKKTPD